MSPLKPLTVKIDDNLEDVLLSIATRRQRETDERVTISDIVRDILTEGARKYMDGGIETTVLKPNQLADGGVDDGYFMEICEPYTPVGRKLLLPINKGDTEYQPIERGIATKSYVIARRGMVPDFYRNNEEVPDMHVEGESIHLPFFEIATYPQWHMREGLGRLDEIITRSKDSVARQEDVEIFKVIASGMCSDHTFAIAGDPEPSQFTAACELIWEHEVKVQNIVYHPDSAECVDHWVREERHASKWPLGQRVTDFEMISSTMMPKGSIYILASPKMVGRIRIGIDVNVLEADNPKALRYGRVVWESIGLGVINDYCMAKIMCV